MKKKKQNFPTKKYMKKIGAIKKGFPGKKYMKKIGKIKKAKIV